MVGRVEIQVRVALPDGRSVSGKLDGWGDAHGFLLWAEDFARAAASSAQRHGGEQLELPPTGAAGQPAAVDEVALP